jgi:Ca2+-binding EF-hand superfamily protein
MNHLSDEQKKEIKQLMEEFDRDKSGYLEKCEFHQLIKAVNEMLAQFETTTIPESKFDEVFAQVDANNDGKIDINELADILNNIGNVI